MYRWAKKCFFFWGTLFSRKLYLKNFNIANLLFTSDSLVGITLFHSILPIFCGYPPSQTGGFFFSFLLFLSYFLLLFSEASPLLLTLFVWLVCQVPFFLRRRDVVGWTLSFFFFFCIWTINFFFTKKLSYFRTRYKCNVVKWCFSFRLKWTIPLDVDSKKCLYVKFLNFFVGFRTRIRTPVVIPVFTFAQLLVTFFFADH